MGASICSPQISQVNNEFNPFVFKYGEDMCYAKISHDDSLVCPRARQVEKNLQDCENRLKASERLYKDPTMNTDPIILRSLASENSQVKCTFQRPHVFLNDPSDPSKGKYKKYKIIDYADCKSSQIIIKDEVLQSFGVLLCFLADNPQLINNIILNDSNSYGLFVLQMNVESKKEFIYIDDYTLCSDKIPLFTQPIRGIYMWPCLIEKAWFKVKGYMSHKIQKKSPIQIIKSFLSFPIKTFGFTDQKVGGENWKVLNENLLRKYLYNQEQGRGYIVSSRAQPPHKIGISGKKHFYLIKIMDFEGQKLYYLRNPYTSFDFRGKYRIIPEQIISLIKKCTGDVKIYEGNFVLNQSQFLEQIQFFSIIHFCKSSQLVTEQPITFVKNEEFLIQMDLKNDGLVSIALNQRSISQKEKKYLPLTYQLVSMDNKTLISDHESDDGCFGVQTTLFFDNVFKQLKAGQYLIRIKKKAELKNVLMKQDKPDKIIVTCSSQVRFDYKHPELLGKHFKEFLKLTGKKRLEEKKIHQKDELANIGAQYVAFWIGDLAILYFEKSSTAKKVIRMQVKFENLKNLECLSHDLGSSYVALELILDNELMIFQKIVLSEDASLGAFEMQPY